MNQPLPMNTRTPTTRKQAPTIFCRMQKQAPEASKKMVAYMVHQSAPVRPLYGKSGESQK